MMDKSFIEEDSVVIKKYFEALSHFKYEDVIEFIEGVIHKNPLFGRAAYNDFKVGAIYCLGIMGNPKAPGFLEELVASRKKNVSEYAATAIKRIKYASKG